MKKVWLPVLFAGKGNYVTKLDKRRIINKFEMTMNNGNLDMLEVAEARMIIETAMVDIMIERAEASDVCDLEFLLESMKKHLNSRR